MRGLIEESIYLRMCDLPNCLPISYLSILTSRWVYVNWFWRNILWVTRWRATLSFVCDLPNCSPTYFVLTYWFRVLFCWGIPWRAKLFSCVTYQIAYLLISYLSIQEVTKRWVYVNWFVGNILVFLVGGALDEEPSYLLVPELLTCLRPTSFLPTHSSLGVGGG